MKAIGKALAIGACLFMASPGLADSMSEATGVNSALGIAPNTGDFVRDAAISDMFEIQASKLAEDRAASGVTKQFAEQMVTDHTGTSKELTALAKGSTVPVPTALDAAHQKMLDTLKSASGADFDSTYKSQQVNAHKDAVSLFERYAKHGDNGDLKNWAGKTLPTLQNHLKMAQGLTA